MTSLPTSVAPADAASPKPSDELWLFRSEDDPGPSFMNLLRLTKSAPPAPAWPVTPLAHGTTIVSLRYDDGVVLAADRRAFEDTTVLHRTTDKVVELDRHSGIAVSGAAGPAFEMARLLRMEIEHYEKVTGSTLSLSGKANSLSRMLFAHLPQTMQGLVVLPILAGFDTARGTGRVFAYDAIGSLYEMDETASGSGAGAARTALRVTYRPRLGRDDALAVAAGALYEAADEDMFTGGPDVVGGVYPLMATITRAGFEMVDQLEVAERFGSVIGARAARHRPRHPVDPTAPPPGRGDQPRPKT